MSKLFFSNDLIGAGLPVLNKHGAIAKNRLMQCIGDMLLARNYFPISSPHVAKSNLFEVSGHYPYYSESMFAPIAGENEKFLLKPMNCPFHILAYSDMGIISYADLPLKIYEFGQVYRNEDSGALNGLFRCRSFTQDDGHIFCTVDQIKEVVVECMKLVSQIAEIFNLVLKVKVSTRSHDSKYIGDDDYWTISEEMLKQICHDMYSGNFNEDIGGAAFYGPKIDFIAIDGNKREWQLGTVQLDFNLPERFNLKYVASNGSSDTPVLIHRALLGSIERFLAILEANDKIPNWLNPYNLAVVNLSSNKEYADKVYRAMPGYPSIIHNPANLSGAIKWLKSVKNIHNIAVIGNREVTNQSVTYNNKEYKIFDLLTVLGQEFSIPVFC